MMSHRCYSAAIVVLLAGSRLTLAQGTKPFSPEIPKIWDEQAMREQELPLVVPRYSPKPLPADYYYKIPARTIYKSYPIYAPGRAPAGYLDKLKTLEPEIAFDATKLKTKEDWIRAGEQVFEAGTQYETTTFFGAAVSDPKWYEYSGVRLTREGIMPYARYLVRQKGKLEVAPLSCANCHTRVLEDGTVIKAGPGNFPLDRTGGFFTHEETLEENRHDFRALFYIPWLPERERQFESYTNREWSRSMTRFP
jgi:hypothetical protein